MFFSVFWQLSFLNSFFAHIIPLFARFTVHYERSLPLSAISQKGLDDQAIEPLY